MKNEEKVKSFYEIHMELDGAYDDQETMDALRKYSRVRNSISRDIVVPEDITLHALHFAIQRAFGWMNSHLHHFAMEDDYQRTKLKELTEGKLKNFFTMCGVYFRAPYESESPDMEDVYYDDDYKDYESPKAWLRRKYTGPYYYGGSFEHYLTSQDTVEEYLKDDRALEIPPTFSEYLKAKENNTKPKANKTTIREMPLENAFGYFDGPLGEILERLRLDEVLTDQETDTYEQMKAIAEDAAEGREERLSRYNEYENVLNETLPVVRKINEIINSREFTNESYEYFRKNSHAHQKGLDAYANILDLHQESDVKVRPFLNELYYLYDYGDGWTVKLTMKNRYTANEENGSVYFTDRNGKPADTETVIALDKAYKGHTVKCIRYDGLPLMDDVGNVHGYARFLKTLKEGEPEERENMKDWSSMQGWTGRSVKPENLL